MLPFGMEIENNEKENQPINQSTDGPKGISEENKPSTDD